jgi:hypothetical protein
MKKREKKSSQQPKINDLEKVHEEKSEQVRGGALNSYVSKLVGEKQGSSRGGS